MVGAAVFSTDLGRLPFRFLEHPYPPVIARSDPRAGVYDFAKSLQLKYPFESRQVFPQTTIDQLWDDVDIHLQSPGFLVKVIQYISYENLDAVRVFAVEWSEKNNHLLRFAHSLGYEENNPLGIVDQLYEPNLIKVWGRPFLWHTINFMRASMFSTTQIFPPPEEYGELAAPDTMLAPVTTMGPAMFSSQPMPENPLVESLHDGVASPVPVHQHGDNDAPRKYTTLATMPLLVIQTLSKRIQYRFD